MTDDEKRLVRRFEELGDRAAVRGKPAYSEFLTLAEQELLPRAVSGNCCLFGGWEDAERRIACFGENAGDCAPVACLRCSPLSAKFAEELGHRDYLGALMSLGLRREVLGDILLAGGDAYLFCLESVADFVIGELTQIRRTAVRCERVDAPPQNAFPTPEERQVVVSSVRLDALVAAVYALSRSEGQELIAQGRVFINGRQTPSASAPLAEGDQVSVRGHGRFQFCGIARETKKGRIRVTVKIY